jgi:hypothetical protein
LSRSILNGRREANAAGSAVRLSRPRIFHQQPPGEAFEPAATVSPSSVVLLAQQTRRSTSTGTDRVRDELNETPPSGDR